VIEMVGRERRRDIGTGTGFLAGISGIAATVGADAADQELRRKVSTARTLRLPEDVSGIPSFPRIL
jgi:hypothetical protein